MKETTIKCDRCQKECSKHYVTIQEYGGKQSNSVLGDTDIRLDICFPCFQKMIGKKKYSEYRKERINYLSNLETMAYLS